ncbi:MAG TPA: diaminopimelate decarboxylase [Polyangiaceae bacterium]|nr:diaminopimelate decarboxylase [Polyangiaceae bacterium]
MPGFDRSAQGHAQLGGTPLSKLLAESKQATPVFLYDLDAIAASTRALVLAFGATRHVVAYAVKANTAGSVVRAVVEAGGGADTVSGGELAVALGAGAPPDRIVMSGVAKLDWELDRAIAAGIRAIQLESVEEIARVAARAKAAGKRARVSVRVNPDVNIDSHAHIATGHDEAKFGIVRSDLGATWDTLAAHAAELELAGVSTHVGSMLATVGPYIESAQVVCDIARDWRARGAKLDFLDFGGGFGIDYGKGPVTPPADFAKASCALAEKAGHGDLCLIVEPGRALVASHGVLIARVVQEKRSSARRFCLVDAGMNDLIRPALYQARHRVEPLDRAPSPPAAQVVGPVCESADDFGLHELGDPLPELVVIRDVGAYGFTMGSAYNGRPLATEVFVRGGKVVHVSAARSVDAWVQSRLDA